MEVVVLIESGPAQVIEAGQATTFGGNGLVLALEMPEDNLAVELRFASSAGDPPSVKTEETGTGWVITCTNFDDATGRGSALPVLLGELGEDLLFLHFRVFRYGSTPDRTVHYTFFRADKTRVGWNPAG